MQLTVAVMMFVIFVTGLVTWALVGLVFWIPILTRATTVFSGMILYATLTHQKADGLREYLRVASGFYADGFRITKEALYPRDGSPQPSAIAFHAGRFILELFWTTAFWVVVLWIGQPDLLKPLTVRIVTVWESFRLIVTSFPILAGILVLVLLTWAVYVWYKSRDLHDSMKLYYSEFSKGSIEHGKRLIEVSKRVDQHDRQLERIDRLLVSLQKETKQK